LRQQAGQRLIVQDRRADHEMTLIDGKVIRFRSADNYECLRGPNIEYLFIDEAAVIHRDAWMILAGALRVGDRRLWVTTTPKGRANWVYDLSKVPSCRVIHAPTDSNPTLAPEWRDLLKRQYTNSFARQELQGEFVDYASLTKPEWYRRIPAEDIPEGFTCLAIDPAYGLHEEADYTAIVIVTELDGIYYIRDVIRQHLTIQQIVETVRSIMSVRRIDCVCVEDMAFRKAVIESLNAAGIYTYGVRPVKDKITRFLPTLDKFERGCILTSESVGDEFADELFSFPGEHDDMVDALVYAIAQIEIMNGTSVEVIARRKKGPNA
jgi:predicted phage terminase large subunit-like protein